MAFLKKKIKGVTPRKIAAEELKLPDVVPKPPDKLPVAPKIPHAPKIPDAPKTHDTPKLPQLPQAPKLPELFDKPKVVATALEKPNGLKLPEVFNKPKLPTETIKAKPPGKAGKWPWRCCKNWCKKSPPKVKDAAPIAPAPAPKPTQVTAVVDPNPKKCCFFPTTKVGYRKWCRFCNYLFFITLGVFTLFYLIRHSPLMCLKRLLCQMLSEGDSKDNTIKTPPDKNKKNKCRKAKPLTIDDKCNAREKKGKMAQDKKSCQTSSFDFKKKGFLPAPPSKQNSVSNCTKSPTEQKKCEKKKKEAIIEVVFEGISIKRNGKDEAKSDDEYDDCED